MSYRARAQAVSSLVWWLPAVLGGVYVLLVLIHLHGILDAVWLSSDNTIDGVLAHASEHAPSGALVTTGDFPHYETIAFTLLTRSWSFYRALWMVTPVVCLVVGVVAVGWSVRRSFGWWAAGLTLAVLVCLGGGGHAMLRAGGLVSAFSIDAHGAALVSAAICGAAVVWVVPQLDLYSPLSLGMWALVIGVIGGLPLAGDTLYLAWGLAPLVLVTVLAAWRGPQRELPRTLAFCVGTVVITLVVAAVFAAIMRAQGVRGFSESYNGFLTFATPRQLITNLQTLLRSLPLISAGDFYGHRTTLHSELQLLSAALLFIALVMVLVRVRQLVVAGGARPDGGGERITARFVHVTWWTAVLVAGIAVFMLGSPNPISTDGRYLLGPFFAIAALLPLLSGTSLGWRIVVTAAASLFAINAIYQFHQGVVKGIAAGYTSASTAHAVATYAQREHVAVAYGDYWNSINLMWNSDFKVDVYPVQPCAHHHRLRLCTFEEISVTGWNTPRAGVRSMLVVNPRGSLAIARDPDLGQPVARTRIDGLRLYVYSYDIASRLQYQAALTH